MFGILTLGICFKILFSCAAIIVNNIDVLNYRDMAQKMQNLFDLEQNLI